MIKKYVQSQNTYLFLYQSSSLFLLDINVDLKKYFFNTMLLSRYAYVRARADHHFHDPRSDHDHLEKCDPRSDPDHLVPKK